jgi:hypothetical protein
VFVSAVTVRYSTKVEGSWLRNELEIAHPRLATVGGAARVAWGCGLRLTMQDICSRALRARKGAARGE